MKDSLYLLDLPESKQNDAIGYDVYVTSLIDAINSNAKMIGLISNYGSGKSTIIKMLKENDRTKNIKFVSINLWKIKDDIRKKGNQFTDDTINIHKFMLRKLINNLPNGDNQYYYKRKIDSNYSIFNFAMKNKKDINMLYLLLGVFFFNIILKLDIVGFSVPRICNFILDLTVSLGAIKILANGELYLSFNRDKTMRNINESETVECFNEIISEINKKSTFDYIVICLEDLDRYNDHEFVIKVLEQIYKFYIENENNTNVKFVLSLKSPYMLVKDSIETTDKNMSVQEKNIVYNYKELYEKIFDIIINLQNVSVQNYDTLLLELLKNKKNELKKINLNIPDDEENISIWSYLYKGKNVTIRDIKHRYNYFLTIYENLFDHKSKTANNDNLIINVETCLFISYLEDEYSAEFYELINDPIKFEGIVTNYLFNKKFENGDNDNEFNSQIENALKNGIIRSDYSMYFYKFPTQKNIKNIFDSTIQDAIFKDNITNIIDFNLYCESANIDEIDKAIRQKVLINGIPNIVFENKIIFEEAYKMFPQEILSYLGKNFLFSNENGSKNVSKYLKKIFFLGDSASMLKIEYLKLLYADLKDNFDDDQILNYRNQLIKDFGFIKDLLVFFDENMPLVTIENIKSASNISVVLSSINVKRLNTTIDAIIDFIVDNYNINYSELIKFLDKIKIIDAEQFKNIYYKFDFENYSKNNKYELFDKFYDKLQLENISNIKNNVLKLKILPLKYEKNIIKSIKNTNDDTKKSKEEIYIEIIKKCKNISSATICYLKQCDTFYTYNEDIEHQLYEKKLYKQYVYSKSNRTKNIYFEKDKFVNLESVYKYYFINSTRVDRTYKVDSDILRFLKANISYLNLNIDKIILLSKLPQNLEDVKTVVNKEYKVGDNSVDEINLYLFNISHFELSDEEEIINTLIDLIKHNVLNINQKTYEHLRFIMNKKYVYKFGKIKKKCL